MFLQLLIYSAGIVNFTYGIYFQLFLVNLPDSVSKHRNSYGGPWKFLTFINLWIQLLYFLVAFLNCLFGSENRSKKGSGKLLRFRDNLFATLAFPIGMFVGIAFWGIFLYDRNLIFPARLDKYIPPFENHVLHTTVIILQILELATTYHVYPSAKKGMIVTALGCLAYVAWVFFIAFHGGFWVYPILKVLSPVMKGVFIVGCFFLGAFLYIIGDVINNKIWSNQISGYNKIKKRKD